MAQAQVKPFKVDNWDDSVPSEVYDLVAKLLIKDGYGDGEIYKVYTALEQSWPDRKTPA